MQSVSNESEFKKKLLEEGMNFVIRRNAEGRIYGVTFIDHKSRCVCNGSELGKNLSANSFNDWWNNSRKPENPKYKSSVSEKEAMMKTEISQSPNAPDFLIKENMPYTYEQNSFDVLGSLLPKAQTEDYEEKAFDNTMKRKIKRRRL